MTPEESKAVLALGLPGVCLAITEGMNEHRLDEYIESGPVPTGVKNILLAAVALTTGK